MTIGTIKTKFSKNQVLIRVFIGLLIVIAILPTSSFCIKFLLLLISGIISGLNYGFNNDTIWQSPKMIVNPHEKLVEEENTKYNENLYVTHQVWVHLLCGIVGAIALYVLLLRMNHYYFWIRKISATDFVLLIVLLLGYTGLLPMTLWFFARKGDIKGP